MAARDYRTPGVYVVEVPTLPPSVVQVATAVPAFLGYTETGPAVGRVSTLLEYETLFGGPSREQFAVDASGGGTAIKRTTTSDHLMYYCVSHYFANGGGTCYVLRLGGYDRTPAKKDFDAGFARLEQEDEPTLVALTDAVSLPTADYFEVAQAALAQCAKLGDRFAIFDVPRGDIEAFRDGIGTAALKYGAAYHPYLSTSLAFWYDEDDVRIDGTDTSVLRWRGEFGGLRVRFDGPAGDDPKVQITKGTATEKLAFEFVEGARTLKIANVGDLRAGAVATAWAERKPATTFTVTSIDPAASLTTTGSDTRALSPPGGEVTLGLLAATNTALHNGVKAAMAAQRVTLPPSSAIAGVYARVDRERGVWKAPANVSLAATIAPVARITNEEQDKLNVDEQAGKSINAIRAFAGKGTLVWGARTLAGNDNEWRYVPVRRLFNVIEESTRKSTSFAVFEPNDATTWLKVKGMIEAYLYGLWERGALAGPTPDDAYFVNVGLGRTMTPQDILEGRMIVEMGVAAVRPAEFIVIRFTHKMQEA